MHHHTQYCFVHISREGGRELSCPVHGGHIPEPYWLSPLISSLTHTQTQSLLHLSIQDISPVEDRRRTRLIGRPSFIPRSSDYLDDTEESSIQQVDAQVSDVCVCV